MNTSPTQVANTAYPVPGMIGTSPVLPSNATVSDQVPMQFDYRQLYTTVMQDWLCMSETEANQVLGGNYIKLPIFNPTLIASITFDEGDFSSVTLYPNPSPDGVLKIQFADVVNASIQFTIYSINGSLVSNTIVYVTGTTTTLELNYLASGTYILAVDWNGKVVYKNLLLVNFIET